MAKSCVWKPSVRTNTGDVRESKLFNDLLSFTSNNREKTKSIWQYMRGQKFIEDFGFGVPRDDANEPILTEVIKLPNASSILNDTAILVELNKKSGAIKNGKINILPDTTDNYLELSQKAIDFNRNSEYREKYVAVVRNNSDQGIYLSIERLTDETSLLAKKITKNTALNESIRNILEKAGVSIGRIKELQNSIKENGIVDYDNAEETADGLLTLIRIADGHRGEKALPEEFAHLMIDVLSDEPLIQRLLNTAKTLQKEILGDEYEAYAEDYAGDEDRLAREAAGKIVYRAMMNVEEPSRVSKSFVQRVFDFICQKIKQLFNPNDVTAAIHSAETIAMDVANRILNEDKIQKIQKEKLKGFTNLKQLQFKAKKAADILQDSIDKSLKKASYYIDNLNRRIRKAEKTGHSEGKTLDELKTMLENYQNRMQSYIAEQNAYFNSAQYNIGIERFVEETAKELQSIVGAGGRMDEVIDGNLSVKEKAFILRNIKNILDSADTTIEEIQASAHYKDSGVTMGDDARTHLTTIASQIKEARKTLGDQTLITFANYLEQFFDHQIEINASNGRKKVINKEDLVKLLETAERDISLADSWLLSAAESDDIIIKLSDQAMKDSKERKRRRTQTITKTLMAAAKKLGRKDTSFIYEKHADGTLAGRYKSDRNWTAYFDDEAKMLKELDEKYGKTAVGNQATLKRAQREAWYAKHIDDNNEPSEKLYGVDLQKEMSPEEYEYYKTFMALREELVQLLPLSTYSKDPYKAIQIQADLLERVKRTPAANWMNEIYLSSKRSLVTQTDDTAYGDMGVKTDFLNNRILSVPIFFVSKIDDADLSYDSVSTLGAFADMAINYDEMSEVADLFELGRNVMEEREAKVEKGQKPLQSGWKAFGQKVKQAVVKRASNNFVDRYNEFLKSQLYGRYMNDGTLLEGEGWEIKSNSAAKMLNKISSLNQLALNGLAGIAAIGNDMLNVESEALAGQFFTNKEIARADKTYLKELPKILGELGNPIKTSKLGLFIEKFDVLHEYDNDIRDLEWDKSRIKKLLSSNALYIFMHMGSHWGETRTALAQAMHAEIKSDDGKETSNLWDILEIEYLDKEHPERGAKLVTKPGYTLTEKQITQYTRKFMGLNERLFGVYNLADRNALQATAVGQLVFLYRKFMIPAISRRFGKADYNLDLDMETEGYYRTAFNFLGKVAKEARSLSAVVKMFKEDLTDNQKANIIRCANELGVFATLGALIVWMARADWDKKDNPWHRRFIYYMTRRMKVEAGAFTPFGIFGETWSIIKSPAAAINTLEGAADILDVVNPWAYKELLGGEDAVIKSGRYKGHNRAYRSFMNSPFVPMNKTIYKMFHPEVANAAYNQR